MTNAAAVSRFLRANGFNPIGSGSRRAGLKVKESYGRVLVVADLNSPSEAANLAYAARITLTGATGARAGYRVETAFGLHAFYVTKS
jgi:hypothetical protein